jgi:hypothetical protein
MKLSYNERQELITPQTFADLFSENKQKRVILISAYAPTTYRTRVVKLKTKHRFNEGRVPKEEGLFHDH